MYLLGHALDSVNGLAWHCGHLTVDFHLLQVLSALMQRKDLTRDQCRAAVSVRLQVAAILLVCDAHVLQLLSATMHFCCYELIMCVSLQSIVEGEINVAQAAAFMVLLHSKVHCIMEQ